MAVGACFPSQANIARVIEDRAVLQLRPEILGPPDPPDLAALDLDDGVCDRLAAIAVDQQAGSQPARPAPDHVT